MDFDLVLLSHLHWTNTRGRKRIFWKYSTQKLAADVGMGRMRKQMTWKTTDRPRTILAAQNASVWSRGDTACSPTALLRKQATLLQGGDVLVLSLELRRVRSAANPWTQSFAWPSAASLIMQLSSGHRSAVLCYRREPLGFLGAAVHVLPWLAVLPSQV